VSSGAAFCCHGCPCTEGADTGKKRVWEKLGRPWADGPQQSIKRDEKAWTLKGGEGTLGCKVLQTVGNWVWGKHPKRAPRKGNHGQSVAWIINQGGGDINHKGGKGGKKKRE